jgi:DNA-binding NtrC family response regulator
MPDLDGLDLFEILQREQPVVLVSGSPDLGRASSAYGALDYLVEPVASEGLRRIVTLAIELRRRGLNATEPSEPRASHECLTGCPAGLGLEQAGAES